MPGTTSTPDAGPDSGYATSLAYSTIRERILSGELAGGQRLREDELANMIGVSRTPVREALRSLAAEGLLHYERNRGVRVESWTLKDLEEVHGLRSLLEPYAASLAATSGLLDFDGLARLTHEMDEAVAKDRLDINLITEINNQFHDTIMEASGNHRLRAVVNSIVQVPTVRRTFAQYTPEDLRRSADHHRELVEALRSGDPVWSESVMRAHMRLGWISTQRRFLETFPGSEPLAT
ncbi:MAG TPA: GntR family transcriptional regulator [Acidimicrobiales bacterium]|nr:GntR family transcriptional regulator [Acidimicrobiales bacterium]